MRTGLLNLYITLVMMLLTMFSTMGRSSPISTQVTMDRVEIRNILSMVISLIRVEGKPNKKNIEWAIQILRDEVSVGELLVETLHLACSSCLEDDCTASCSFGNKVGKQWLFHFVNYFLFQLGMECKLTSSTVSSNLVDGIATVPVSCPSKPDLPTYEACSPFCDEDDDIVYLFAWG